MNARLASGLLFALYSLLPLASGTAHGAGTWRPERPIEIVVPTAPGGSADRSARLLQRVLQEHALVPVAVSTVNKPGGGGAVSLAYINQKPGDAHVVAITTPNIIANDINGRTPVKYTDITPLANLFSENTVIAVRADSPLRNGQDFIERLRKDPASLAVSTPTTLGSINHMSFALVAKAGGIDIRKIKAVILSSGGDAVTALIGGHVDAHAGTPSSVLPMVQEGKARVLGVLAEKRLSGPYADTPTWKEQGYPAVMDTWRGVVGPKGMTPEQIAYWEQILAKAVQTDSWKQELARNTWEHNFMNSAATRKFFDAEYAEHKAILTELGLRK